MSGKPSGSAAAKRLTFVDRLVAKLGRPIMRRFSDLACESLKEPGSWRCLEIVYRNEPRGMLDRFFLGSRSARGARSRLQILRRETSESIEEYAVSSNPVRIISLGSGPGHEILGAMENLGYGAAVEAMCVDRNAEALLYGRSLAAEKGLVRCVRYVCANILHMAVTTLRSCPGSLTTSTAGQLWRS